MTEVRAHKDWSLESDSTMSDKDCKLTPRALQDIMNMNPEVEDNDDETVIAPPGDVDSVKERTVAS
jgi:hypothetical protein